MSQIPATYVMGHDDRERRRLSLQASILNPLSDQLLRRAGLSAGLRVLDIGCGVGELSMVAARLDPRVVVRMAHSRLSSGGVAVFQEYDFSVVHRPFPEAP